MENFEIVKAIENFTNRLDELNKAVKIDALKSSVDIKELAMLDNNFWSDINNAQKILKEVKDEKDTLLQYQTLTERLEELKMYFEMRKTEGEDLGAEIEETILLIETELANFEIKMLLSKEYDSCDAIMELHPGAGGTESQDWTEMLFRMYKRYAERKGYELEVVDYQDGEEAGIKSVTFIVHGDKAYGYLKGEQGVHRLVRISPFDSNSRRHTSFGACTITPVVDNVINIDVKPEEIRIDTYRASGAGGQHINKTDSAIRITHLKTGIVVACQNERSQIQNRENALKILKSRLYQLELEERESKIKKQIGEIVDNSFGSQIRSYVFHPYSLIKDHRTNFELFNTTAVMDGEIDGFINAYLKSGYNKK